ncbi:hypothetical protein [Inquilinus limosus]|uniref:hypothetical protein n=1 Tax=Inquilinus limosus TaxID=171674 RepID=UPI0015C65F1D|nr:hypothetical protein [Inquilinus limosus]
MPYEEWVKREDEAFESIWDDGISLWDVTAVNFALSPQSKWDVSPGGEVWTPRLPYPES